MGSSASQHTWTYPELIERLPFEEFESRDLQDGTYLASYSYLAPSCRQDSQNPHTGSPTRVVQPQVSSAFVEHDLRVYFWQPDITKAGFWAAAGWNPFFDATSSSEPWQNCCCSLNRRVDWRCELCHEWRCNNCVWLCLPQGEVGHRHIWTCSTCQVAVRAMSAWHQCQVFRHLTEIASCIGPWSSRSLQLRR